LLRINVLVAATSPDVKAEVISEVVGARPDMNLVKRGVVPVTEANAFLESIPSSPQCAFVLVGPPWETDQLAERWLVQRADLVVLRVDVVDDIVRITLRDPSLDSLLSALRDLVERVSRRPQERVAHIQLRSADTLDGAAVVREPASSERLLLQAAKEWVHEVLRDAISRIPDDNGDVHGLSLTRATLLQSLDTSSDRSLASLPARLVKADETLSRALAEADVSTEPLAAASRAFGLGSLDFRILVLALAPELDHRFQRCIGVLLDDMSRRVGTVGLSCALLGDTARVRADLNRGRALEYWLVFDGCADRLPAADESLRLDPFLAQWLLGDRDALAADPQVRRAVRVVPWAGAVLVRRPEDRAAASQLLRSLRAGDACWLVLGGDDPASWRAVLEVGAEDERTEPIRVDAARLATVDALEIEECARRLGRMSRLTGAPVIVDVTKVEGADEEDGWMRLFLATLGRTAQRAALICCNAARVVPLLGSAPYELVDEPALSIAGRIAAVRAAAAGADAYVSEEAADAISRQHPLRVDGLEHAMRLARHRPLADETSDRHASRFTMACKEVAARGVSPLAEIVEPAFELDDVVLPPDRMQQLVEIVDHVRLASRVLDEWKFREQLPYGRGVTALFYGPSGVGKTMAALGIARRLRNHVLRLDLSRIESKYIGDTPKNIDRAFRDAEESGAAILIDEAEALLGKRSEVKDAHDRYANIEVAYLLQRMEAYSGLAILTTNFRQNIDPAFLRRLRFIIDFPRPDVEAREKIWRQCLPPESHALDDAAFRHVARRIDLTGGHIRQITLRAAFVAAAAGTRIGIEHVAYAARAELAKLGMPPVELELVDRRRAA